MKGNIYLTLLDQTAEMRRVESFGYMDTNEKIEAAEIGMAYMANCHELAHHAVKRGGTYDEIILGINHDLDLIYREAEQQNLDFLDTNDFSFLKAKIAEAVHKELKRSPIQRFTQGILNRYPQLIIIPMLTIVIGGVLIVAWLSEPSK